MNVDLELMRRSQVLIGQNPDMFVDAFYDYFFKHNQEIKEVFRNTDMRVQKLELFKGFMTIFSMLEEPNKLNEYLVELGTRHLCYEVESEHYFLVGPSLLYAVKLVHKDEWDEGFESQWVPLFSYIVSKMKIGSQKVSVA